ncbi:Uncharacterized protein dnm_028400 [Desulfonema magnum]|uniref:Uncharacterized protein n=1 Tax=Desulfonema magnum TaxID=45655 RepID=A0A975GME4_9BACT|nr:Uncharacterized protein dnm_028400 [Desulfonema magnum]
MPRFEGNDRKNLNIGLNEQMNFIDEKSEGIVRPFIHRNIPSSPILQ